MAGDGIGALSLFVLSLFGGGGLLTLLLKRTFSDKDTHAAGYAEGRKDTEARYRRAIDELIRVNAQLVALAPPDRAMEAAMLAHEELAALHRFPNPDPDEDED